MTVTGVPIPGIVAVIYVLLFIAGLVSFAVLTNGAEFPRPFGALEKGQQDLPAISLP